MRLIISLSILLLVLCASGDVNDEGITIQYDVISTVPTIDGAMTTEKDQVTLLSQGNLLRLEKENGREKCQLLFRGWIADFDKQTITTLVDSRGEKLKTVKPFDQSKSIVGELGDETKVKLVSGSKTILGYTCKKAVYNKMEIWYAPSLPVYLSPQMPNLIKGAVLQITDGPFQHIAKKVSKGKIADHYYNSAERKVVTEKELQKITEDCLQLR